jgi:hypothetical protein
VNSNAARGEVYSVQHYVINSVSDLWQVGGFLRDITEILLKVALNAITIFICLFVIVCGLFEWKRICAGILSFVYICILVGDSVIKRRVFAIQ